MSQVQKIMNATIVTGEYQNNQGETKKKYLTVGTLFIYADGGMSLKIEEGISVQGNISFYERTNNQASQNNPQNNYNGAATPHQNQNQSYGTPGNPQNNYQMNNNQYGYGNGQG